MGRRGPKSSASLALVDQLEGDRAPGLVVSQERPQPPDGLSERAAELWGEIVDDLPATWFPRHTHELLAAYCRHAATLERLESLIQATEEGDDDDALDLDKWLKLIDRRDKEGRALSSLATRLRLTIQATRSADTKKPPKKIARPWDQP